MVFHIQIFSFGIDMFFHVQLNLTVKLKSEVFIFSFTQKAEAYKTRIVKTYYYKVFHKQ